MLQHRLVCEFNAFVGSFVDLQEGGETKPSIRAAVSIDRLVISGSWQF